MGCYCTWRCEAFDFGRCKQNTVNILEITKPALSATGRCIFVQDLVCFKLALRRLLVNFYIFDDLRSRRWPAQQGKVGGEL